MTSIISSRILVLPLLLLALPSNIVVASFDYMNFAQDAANQERCKPYKCDEGYEPVPKKKHEYQSAGCNAMGSMSLFDDEEEEVPYETCCHHWHACYQICGTLKKDCDRDYKQCVDEKCKATGKEYDNCLENANQQTMLLAVGGCRSHEVEQSKHCACTTKYGDRHLKAREESLRHFYRMHAPENKSKVNALLEKADTTQKLGKLLVKLVKKYPKAIEIVEDPQSRMYRQMFGAGFGGGKDGDEEEEDGDEWGFGKQGKYDPDDDFDVNEDLGGYGEDEAAEEEDEEEDDEAEEMLRQAEVLRIKAEKLKREKKKKQEEEEKKKKKQQQQKMEKKKPKPPPPVEEVEEEPPIEDEFNQYEEL
ncbi:Group XII secretory phospholipase A2 precursor (PLA2G12) [Seminavis robusta]|uniref:Group XII secretory phospholipase A2 (PLA2G12) n=1 Tax=Seminavis robusta TaxID=568900 RepID=A0A9N8DQ42_9STRA|nr:Group XII secretory phospholipase A2 precursor (PLA2G12) [Seminavis robusta]|eukprot:Sro179_g078380.1 Group XII secretory phospholipase A2 precursor (PLA2G12) (362) ;mRNA; r:16108-17193